MAEQLPTLDAMIAHFERFGTHAPVCLDCEVGEPHVCPLRFKKDHEQRVRALQIVRDLEALNG